MFVTKLALSLVASVGMPLAFASAVVLGPQLLAAGPPTSDPSGSKVQELENKRQWLKTAKADLDTSTAAKHEALGRLNAMVAANNEFKNAYSKDDIRGQKLTCNRLSKKEAAHRAIYEMAQLELSPGSTPLDIMKQNVAIAKADLEMAIAEKDEAVDRWDFLSRAREKCCVAEADIRAAKLTVARCYQKTIQKQSAYEQALRELEAFNGI
jgi:hypothetical protein